MMGLLLVWLSIVIKLVASRAFVVQTGSEAQMGELLERYALNGLVDTYELGSGFKAFGGEFNEYLLERLYRDPDVVSISIDRDLDVQEYVLQGNAPPHLSRISSSSPTVHQPYMYHSTAGSGVDVYVFDTGIDSKNPGFGSINVMKLADFTEHPLPGGFDPHGHGTSMASIVASETFGVLKKCNLVDVRTVDDKGHSKLSTLLTALSSAEKHVIVTGRPSLFMIPLITTKKNSILNSACESISKEIAIIAPAGNQGLDACSISPASCEKRMNMLVSGSLDKRDDFASFTNHGICVDVFTSGTDVTSLSATDFSKNSMITQINGSSASCAIATGVVGYYMSLGFSAAEAIQRVKDVSFYHNEIERDYKILQLKP